MFWLFILPILFFLTLPFPDVGCLWIFAHIRQDILKTCFAMIARLLLLNNMFWVQVAREDQTQYIIHHMRHFWKHVWIQVAREDCQTLNIIWDILKTCFVCRLLAKTRHYTLYIVWDSCIQVAREDCQTLYLYIIHYTLQCILKTYFVSRLPGKTARQCLCRSATVWRTSSAGTFQERGKSLILISKKWVK